LDRFRASLPFGSLRVIRNKGKDRLDGLVDDDRLLDVDRWNLLEETRFGDKVY
jgi:hypothetical protein